MSTSSLTGTQPATLRWPLLTGGKEFAGSPVPGEGNTTLFGPQQLYRLYPDKVVTPDGKLMAWVRPTPQKPWGEVIPVEKKDLPKPPPE